MSIRLRVANFAIFIQYPKHTKQVFGFGNNINDRNARKYKADNG